MSLPLLLARRRTSHPLRATLEITPYGRYSGQFSGSAQGPHCDIPNHETGERQKGPEGFLEKLNTNAIRNAYGHSPQSPPPYDSCAIAGTPDDLRRTATLGQP
ncbi:hypothetical protein GCM10027294_16380 [Marinactinospora endophytica]